MLQNYIATANALLILMILTAKVSCQLGHRFEQVVTDDDKNLELDASRNNYKKLFGRQLNPNFDFDLMHFNQRNVDNSMYSPSIATAGSSSGGHSSNPTGSIVGPGPPAGRDSPPSGSNTGGHFSSIKVKIPPPTPEAQESPSTSPVEPSSGKQSTSVPAMSNGDDFIIADKENDEMRHGLQRLIQQLYVAQAQVQLEANEIQRAQGVAAAAQQSLEEASNNIRVITAALHAAQQTVAAAAIRAQTAQLQLAAHDQLLFAARQRVDALSAQIVSVKAEEGIQPTKMIVDLQALLNKLKAPLPDAQKPTPVPSILGGNGGQEIGIPTGAKTASRDGASGFMDNNISKSNGTCAYSYSGQDDLTHYDENIQKKEMNEQDEESPNIILRESNNLPEDEGNLQQKPINELKDENIGRLIAKSNNIRYYADSFLKDSSDGSINLREIPDDNIKKELSILNEKDLRNLVDFIIAMHRQDQERNDNLVVDNKKVFAKHADQKYINDFLNTIKNVQLKDRKYTNLKVNEVINKRDNILKKNTEKENEYDGDNEPIFNMEKAFDFNSENFQESLP